MPKVKKVPSGASQRGDHKRVRVRPPEVTRFPSWRFSTVDQGGPFKWPKGDADELLIVQKLHSFDSMRWDEIEGNDHHSIPVEKLSKDAQRRLEEINQDDVAEVFSFHFTGKKRIIGIRDAESVKLLWWDPDHGVCLSAKKHT